MLILGFVGPIITAISTQINGDTDNMFYGGGYYIDSGEELTIEGVTISPTNPFYGELYYQSQDIMVMLESLNAEEKGYAEELLDLQIEYYLKYAQEITDYNDYRTEMVYYGAPFIAENYVLQAEPNNLINFTTGVNAVTYVEEIEEIVGLSAEEKALQLEENQALLQSVEESILGDDFQTFCDNMIEMNQLQIENIEKQIEAQEEAMVANPELEESGAIEISRLESEIIRIKESSTPTWEYRKEHNLIPTEDVWENNAISMMEGLTYTINEEPISEDLFLQDPYYQEMYSSYAQYLEGIEKGKVEAQNDMVIAQKSLDTGEPDMRFVPKGARYAVNSSLSYSMIVSFFAILIGGFIVANEFQSGTIRLMMIRPTTRWKVYGSKFIAGLLLTVVVYLIGMILNIIVNGITLGFGDYAYPNYTVTGEINFWGLILIRTFICMVSIVCFYAVSFGCSALIRNVAVAIIIPSAALIGGSILNSMLAYSRFATLLPYTPLPYIFLYQFYSEYSVVDAFSERGIEIGLGMGVVMLLFIAVLFFGVGGLSFRNKDITN